ncbi:hypothetical protein B6N13_18230 [Marinomonas sp. UCMA 3892]|uniref:hypothetical protein n=1 Tax=unclassified Marinomonas TaxID=196814 RepID=UPI001469E2B2|nr:hypothetical protein [Marinomonas sp. UCMA 3892]NLV00012.1 hypothetical protein [Marinomonas sp. UCMA 3892]
MSNDLTIKGILSEKLNRFLNPNFDTKFIWLLLTSGIALVSYQRVIQLGSSLEILKEDLYIKLSLNSGVDSVFIVIGAFMIVSSVVLFTLKQLSNKTGSFKRYKTLSKAARDIRPLMDDNRRIFTTFGPNTSAGSTDELRHDYEVWEQLKLDQIVPNNDSILSILNRVKKLDKREELVVSEMKSHIQAFKKHCEDPSFDYSQNQFPIAFSDLILSYCSFGKNSLEKYKTWIVEQSKIKNANIEAAYIFGSALYGAESTDVDLLIKTKAIKVEDIKVDADFYEKLKDRFYLEQGLKLHLKVYSELEKRSYDAFKAKLAKTIRII